MKVLYVDCFSGMSGDMWLGALADIGAPIEAARDAIIKLGIPGLFVDFTKTSQSGITATKASVLVPETAQPLRKWGDIRALIEDSDIEKRAKGLSLQVFARLAEAEASVHGCAPDDVHFHEVGAWDSLADIVGTCALYAKLDIDLCICAPIPLPRGFAKTAHGTMPLPAPATLTVLSGAKVTKAKTDKEIVTPTGAALTVVFASEYAAWPNMKIDSIGYGCGTMRLPWPNVLRLALGHSMVRAESLFVVESNIDDTDQRIYPVVLSSLLDAGALDAWMTPVIMKKGRPGIMLCALADADHLSICMDTIARETSTLGVRYYSCDRYAAPRKTVIIDTKYGKVRLKYSPGSEGQHKLSVEFEDALAIAKKYGLPVIQIIQELYQAGNESLNEDPSF